MNDFEAIFDCNKYAIEALQEENFSTAFELLRKAKNFLRNCGKNERTMKLKAITYNNLGCFYKKQRNLKKALTYLLQALSYELHLPKENSTIEGTYLNLAKIYSELAEHENSLNFALKAIKSIEDNFRGKLSVVSSLIIAYQQAGNEYLCLGHRSEGKIFLAQSYELALKYFGLTADITKELEKNLKKAKIEEKNNPVIDKMISYFEKHIGYSHRSSKITLASKKQMKSHKKIHSLQPIVNYERERGRMCYSKSPVKVFKKPIEKLNKIHAAGKVAEVKGGYTERVKGKAVEKLEKFNKNLSIFKKYRSVQRRKDVGEICVMIQKWVRGWIARRGYRRRVKIVEFVQERARKYLKKIEARESKNFSQQFSPERLKNIKKIVITSPKSAQTTKKSLKKRSFLEKIIFLQRQLRLFLQKPKKNL